MSITEINSYEQLQQHLSGSDKAMLLLFKKDSEVSRCAYQNFAEAAEILQNSKALMLAADVQNVRDIHTEYQVNTVPSLLVFQNSTLKNIIKGCHKPQYYNDLADGNLFSASVITKGENKIPRVIVYSTPSCSWCNTLKSFLKKHNVVFQDIDVAANEKAAAEMVKKSGQQGVPQTEINGEIIVGFDQAKIKKLLNI